MVANPAVNNCPGRLEVDYVDNQGKLVTKVYSDTSSRPLPHDLKKLKVGEAVLSRFEAHRDGYEDQLAATKVFSAREEMLLRSHGAIFPEVPPDLHQQGFYG